MLFNYKRTVQDFGKCPGSKSRTDYGFSHVSECVGNLEFDGPCPDSSHPVPCGDGKCHSDYIDCLRAVTQLKATLGGPEVRTGRRSDLVLQQLRSSASASPQFKFGSGGAVADEEERFMTALGVKYGVLDSANGGR